MSDTATALRDADGVPVFVLDDGSYAESYPQENIVEHDGSIDGYIVYGFVGSHQDYEERSWEFDDKQDALNFATDVYGDSHTDFEKTGEVFEVEVHQKTA